MKTVEQYLNFTGLCGFSEIVEVVEFKHKRNLSLNDLYALYYAAMKFFSDNELIIDKIGFDDSNSICDDSLYLNNFDGVYISDTEKFTYIFLDETGAFLAAVHDDETDDFKYYMIN